jgi:uncharacterized membrane protein YhiD involved in acid resistance
VFTDIPNGTIFPIGTVSIVSHILAALLCGLAIAWLYRQTYRGPGYSIAFVNSLVLLTMITALVILTIGNNLARAFGLVGAMSIIRFRTAVKETQDIVYIFFALSIGMAAGVGYHKIAFLGTVSVGAVIYVFSKTKAAAPRKEDYLLQLSYSPNGEPVPQYLLVVDKYCRQHTVVNTRSVGTDGKRLEVSYYVRLKDKELNGQFVRELQQASGVGQVNLYFDEEEF